MNIELKFNKDFCTASSIKKYAGTSHGIALMVLSLLDNANISLDIDVTCSELYFQDMVKQVNCVLNTTKVLSVNIRAVTKNTFNLVDENELTLLNIKLSDKTPSKVICDISIENNNVTWTFWRNPEIKPRTLKITSKKN